MTLVKELKPESKVKGIYLCKYKQVLKNKNGKDYYSLKLQDYTGTVDAKIWCMHAGIGDFAPEEIVEVEGEIVLFQDNLQFNVHKIERAEEGSYDLKQFIPYTPKDMEVLEKELFGFIDQIEDSHMRKLVEHIFYEEEVYARFMKGSAAKSVHHAYLGGLLEHTVSVTKIGLHLTSLYEKVQKDYVIAGCMLHDIGKIIEFSPFPQNDYTDEGQLLGHIILGAQKVKEVADKIEGFPKEMSMLLQHILLAHHGEYEYGSPKRPKCIEAMIVHLADLSDSKLKMFEELLLADEGEEKYMGYHKILGRNIRRI